jgi:peptidoglycan/xylan/chitin deacetylase (PgdA/CDA1 family)
MTLRLDRLLTVAVFRPLVRGLGIHGRSRIPILMYHSISKGSEKGMHPYFETRTDPGLFARQMNYLNGAGYSVLDLCEAAGWIRSGKCPGPKSVVLTFDDGFLDFYTNAYPVLQTCGFPCALFLTTAGRGKEATFMKGRKALTWETARLLGASGSVRLGSHTVTHPQLRRLTKEEIEYEIESSKKHIETETGCTVDCFSYPYAFPEEDGAFKKYLRSLLEKLGYRCGVTTAIGRAGPGDDFYFLRRIPVNSHDDMDLFIAKLEGAYDWLHVPQYFYKKLKRCQTKNLIAHA